MAGTVACQRAHQTFEEDFTAPTQNTDWAHHCVQAATELVRRARYRMRTKDWIVTITCAGVCSCSGPTPGGFAEDGGTSVSQGGDAAAPAVTLPGQGAEASTGPVFRDAGAVYIGVGDAGAGPGAVPDASIETTVTLTMDTVTVAPGAELFQCQTFANPFGKDVDIKIFDGQMSVGSHHFFLFELPNQQNTPVHACSAGGLEIHPFPYLSQSPHLVQSYPDGMGSFVPASTGFMMQTHYLNAGASPIQARAQITMSVAKPGTVTTHVGTVFMNQTFLAVPPTPKTSPMPSSKSCALPSDVNLLSSWSHMHRWAVGFKASANGSVFYQTNQWSEPPVFAHNPPIHLASGTSLTWTCDYYNDTGSILTFGESANKNVMCIYVGQYYPADPNNAYIQCL
jgi:hypothetical protein